MIFFLCSTYCPITRLRSYGHIYTIFDDIIPWQVSTFRKYNKETHFVQQKVFLRFTNLTYLKHNIQLGECRPSCVDKMVYHSSNTYCVTGLLITLCSWNRQRIHSVFLKVLKYFHVLYSQKKALIHTHTHTSPPITRHRQIIQYIPH
jgi:aromatic ring hydroxylase